MITTIPEYYSNIKTASFLPKDKIEDEVERAGSVPVFRFYGEGMSQTSLSGLTSYILEKSASEIVKTTREDFLKSYKDDFSLAQAEQQRVTGLLESSLTQLRHALELEKTTSIALEDRKRVADSVNVQTVLGQKTSEQALDRAHKLTMQGADQDWQTSENDLDLIAKTTISADKATEEYNALEASGEGETDRLLSKLDLEIFKNAPFWVFADLYAQVGYTAISKRPYNVGSIHFSVNPFCYDSIIGPVVTPGSSPTNGYGKNHVLFGSLLKTKWNHEEAKLELW